MTRADYEFFDARITRLERMVALHNELARSRTSAEVELVIKQLREIEALTPKLKERKSRV
jgi:uncharacterized coiled-coil protein SlyX